MTHNEARDLLYTLDHARNLAYANRGEPVEAAAALLRERVEAEVRERLLVEEMARVAVKSWGMAA